MLLMALVWVPGRAAVSIPPFTPNVVDPAGYLDASARQAVNEELLRIRGESGIWGAVFVVEHLDGQAIESLAEQAFAQWQLGQAGVDNGLLLVLAMNDRRSRFEVGYGLEGVIPDVAARRALDAYLAPRLREGQTAAGIVEAFGFLSRLVAQDPAAAEELRAAASASDEPEWRKGLPPLMVYLFCLWVTVPLRNAWVLGLRRRLFAIHPHLALKPDTVTGPSADDGRWTPRLFVLGFLSLNPGVFVFVLSALEPMMRNLLLPLPLGVLALVVGLSGRKYRTPERYQAFLDGVGRQRDDLLRKGFLERDGDERYRYTPAYHASCESSSSGSSGSSSSSSSGGGRSGGGGASSGW